MRSREWSSVPLKDAYAHRLPNFAQNSFVSLEGPWGAGTHEYDKTYACRVGGSKRTRHTKQPLLPRP